MALECLYFGADSDFKTRMGHLLMDKGNRLKMSDDHVLKDNDLYQGLLVVQLDAIGQCLPFYKWLLEKKDKDEFYFKNSVLGFVVKSDSDYFTKKFTSSVMFLMNQMGARFVGHPLVESIKEDANLKKWQMAEGLSRDEVLKHVVDRLVEDLVTFKPIVLDKPKVLVLHAGTHEKSNTLALWSMVREHLGPCDISEFHVEDGTAIDCYGCSFDTCIYYSLHKSCFYGGVITEELLPLMEDSDIIVWICPNYNDAISSKLSAVINRLTVLYRRVSFKQKRIYALIVSANSGSDSVASQLIDALVINKGFQLPPSFALMALASDEGSIYKIPDIRRQAAAFARQFKEECL